MIFTSSSDDHAKHNGPVVILRQLTSVEADIEDVGIMFKCRDQNGQVFDAFADELIDD